MYGNANGVFAISTGEIGCATDTCQASECCSICPIGQYGSIAENYNNNCQLCAGKKQKTSKTYLQYNLKSIKLIFFFLFSLYVSVPVANFQLENLKHILIEHVKIVLLANLIQ